MRNQASFFQGRMDRNARTLKCFGDRNYTPANKGNHSFMFIHLLRSLIHSFFQLKSTLHYCPAARCLTASVWAAPRSDGGQTDDEAWREADSHLPSSGEHARVRSSLLRLRPDARHECALCQLESMPRWPSGQTACVVSSGHFLSTLAPLHFDH